MTLQEALHHLKLLSEITDIDENDFLSDWDDVASAAFATILNAVVKGELK